MPTYPTSFLKQKLLLYSFTFSFGVIFIFGLYLQSNNSNAVQTDTEHQKWMEKLVKKLDKDLEIELPKPKETKMLYPQDIQSITTTVIDHQCEDFGANLNVLMFVFSSVHNFERRATIRQTWAKQLNNRTVKMMFATGLADSDAVQEHLNMEDRKHGDILQFGFVDAYHNLTLKSLAILRWTLLQCPLTRFVFKADDDSIVNVDNLVDFCNNKASESIYGHVLKKHDVIRDKHSKYYISESDYRPSQFPTYVCSQWLIPGSLISKLYSIAIEQSLPALPFEDVFITGVAASRANISRQTLPGIVYLRFAKIDQIDRCAFNENTIFWDGNDRWLTEIWERIENTSCLFWWPN